MTPQIIGQSDPDADAPRVPDGAPAHVSEGSGVDADTTTPVEIGGRKGPDPTRYGDWEKNGRCIDF